MLVLVLYLVFRGSGSGASSDRDGNVVTDAPATMSAPAAGPLTPATYAGPATPLAPVAPPAAPVPNGAVVVVAPQAAPSAQPAPDGTAQFRLLGVLSRGAVIGMPDGSQRFVPIGREIVPGVVLRGVDVHHAILQTASGEMRLGFDATPPPAAISPTPPVAQPQLR
ncbi:MAG: hypothetical protein JO276_09480 [Sphingomonadaceae bacterium]|nr:hypothetical protein [Sphingomonadaceae bacterium]